MDESLWVNECEGRIGRHQIKGIRGDYRGGEVHCSLFSDPNALTRMQLQKIGRDDFLKSRGVLQSAPCKRFG